MLLGKVSMLEEQMSVAVGNLCMKYNCRY